MHFLGIWIILDHFWAILGPKFQFRHPILAKFFSSKYRHVGCQERCHVMPCSLCNLFKPKGPNLSVKGTQSRSQHSSSLEI